MKNWHIVIIVDTINPEKIWHEHRTDLSTSLVTCSHFTLGNLKNHFSTLLFIYFRLLTFAQKKTSSNCCAAALAAYLLLFSASYYLHSSSTASGARYRRSACIDTDMLRLAAVACCDMGWISTLHDWTVSKKIGSMYSCRTWSLWTLAVTLLAWHFSCHTSQWFFSEPPTTKTHNWLSSKALKAISKGTKYGSSQDASPPYRNSRAI